jgi:hypothetical protein
MPKARKIVYQRMISQIQVNEWGLKHTLEYASPFDIIRYHDEYIEVEGEISEIKDYFGRNNPEMEYLSEFEHIKRFR